MATFWGMLTSLTRYCAIRGITAIVSQSLDMGSLSPQSPAAPKSLQQDKEVGTSLCKEVESKTMREFCPRKQWVSRGLRPNLLILDKGAIASLSLFKPFSNNRETHHSTGTIQSAERSASHIFGLQVRPPGIERKTCRNPKNGKTLAKK